jgi:hypothetical protein
MANVCATAIPQGSSTVVHVCLVCTPRGGRSRWTNACSGLHSSADLASIIDTAFAGASARRSQKKQSATGAAIALVGRRGQHEVRTVRAMATIRRSSLFLTDAADGAGELNATDLAGRFRRLRPARNDSCRRSARMPKTRDKNGFDLVVLVQRRTPSRTRRCSV